MQRGKEEIRITHRYEFHTLIRVSRGRCTKMVDFKSISCAPGSLLVLRAGQAHNYGQDEDWISEGIPSTYLHLLYWFCR
ncbi:MAG: AraC family ligand binding domain-containing protein [Burkholderiales bacterium]|nr:AraC family ligand binding domain-containing protein [Burkholderiales bacterium]MBI3727587.1 AraC family ligand binding domain-containing protein [Burkholderiales bacterium]